MRFCFPRKPAYDKEGIDLKKNRRTSSFFWLLFGFATFLFILSNAESLGDTVSQLLDGEFWRLAPHRISEKAVTFIREYSFSFLWAYGIFIAGIIFLEERNPDRTIAWLLVLLLLPVVGFLVYFFFGPDLRERENFRTLKKKRRKNRSGLPFLLPEITEPCAMLGEQTKKTAFLLAKSAKARISVRNSVEMLVNGEATFMAIKDALRKATTYIHLEYYSIANDIIGSEIRDILLSKAQEGVSVRVIYDSVGSWKLGKKYIDALKRGGVLVHSFLSVSFPMLRRDLNYRNHRKIIVVDGALGFVGGLNIGDSYIHGEPGLGIWRDTHLRIEGEAVACLDDIFAADWAFCDSKPLPAHTATSPLPDSATPLQIVSSGPDSNWRSILHGYFSMIVNAEESLWLCTPYLVPGKALSTALTTAAMSGIDVRVMIPHATDHALVHWASLSAVEELLRAGVKVYSYRKGFHHAKIMIADNSAVSVGTANFDARSLEINFEVQAFIYEREIVRAFRREFVRDLDDCTQFRLHDWLRRPLRSRILEAAGRLSSSQL